MSDRHTPSRLAARTPRAAMLRPAPRHTATGDRRRPVGAADGLLPLLAADAAAAVVTAIAVHGLELAVLARRAPVLGPAVLTAGTGPARPGLLVADDHHLRWYWAQLVPLTRPLMAHRDLIVVTQQPRLPAAAGAHAVAVLELDTPDGLLELSMHAPLAAALTGWLNLGTGHG